MKLTDLFASMQSEDDETRLDGSGGLGGSTGDTGEGEDAQQGVYARLKRPCPCCHGSGEHASGFECYRCDASGSLDGDDPGPDGCDGDGGMSTTASEQIGEPSYEPDDGYKAGLWNEWHPRLPETIHRALGVSLSGGHPAHNTALPMHERAHAVLAEVTKRGLGMHWTSDPGYHTKHLAPRLMPGETPVVVHAKTPPREHIEDNDWVHEDRAIRDWDMDPEKEVPVKRNAPVHITGITWGKNHHDFDQPITRKAVLRYTATVKDGDDVPSELLNPHGHKVVVRTGEYDNVEMVPRSALLRYATQETSAERAKEVGTRIANRGEMEPLILHYHPGSGEAYLGEGNHRLRAAKTLKMSHLPVRVTRANYGLPGEGAPTPQRHPQEGRGHVPYDIRPSDLGLASRAREAARQDRPRPDVHRGLSVVLPTEVHNFVHDEEQPQSSRAHMLLAHVRKQKPEITSEELHGTTGGVGNFWSPSQSKAEEYGGQAGYGAYRQHEIEHGCGDERDGEGGCPTTHVVLHAHEPAEKHQWSEIFRPGEEYDPEISWRLPVRPDAPMKISGISWREGQDQKGFGPRDPEKPYQSYDFTAPVKKRAAGLPLEGARGTDHHGHPVRFGEANGWEHLDGSVGEEGPTGHEQVDDFPVHVGDHVWLPHGKYWGPNSAQVDQRLFDGDRLRPEIREDILGRVGRVLGRKYLDWQRWTRVYFAGSQAAQWTDENGEGNGDFDILIGIDWPEFRKEYPQAEGTDDQIAAELTTKLWHQANISDYRFHLKDGRTVGPFDRTFFVNPRAWDIRALKPYAAYDVTNDTWAVKPIQVPKDWGTGSLPSSYWGYADSLVKEIEAIGTLPPEERHRMAANLWEELHTHRSDAFGDGGKGLYDLSNLVEKYLDQHPAKPWARLVEWKNQAPSGPEPWVPTTARRTTLTSLMTTAEVRQDLKDPQSGEEYDGMMIALVPPKKVCQDLVVEKGEPHESMHVTLAYLGSKDEYSAEQLAALPDLVKGWAATKESLTSRIGGAGTFVNPGQHVLMAHVDIPHGTTFRDDLVRFLEGHGYQVRHDHGWTPHITLAYRTSHVRFLPKVEPVSWEDTQVWCCIGGHWESFPLAG